MLGYFTKQKNPQSKALRILQLLTMFSMSDLLPPSSLFYNLKQRTYIFDR